MKVMSLIKPYRIAMIIAWILMLIELMVELVSPLLMAKIIDEGVLQADLHTVTVLGLVLIGISLLAFASGISNSYIAYYAGQNLGYDIRKNVYAKIQRLPFSSLNQFPTSSFITRLTNDVTQIQNVLFMSLRIALRSPLLIIFGTVMALFVHAKLALIFVVAIPLLVVFLIFIMRKGFVFFQSVQKKLDRVNSVMRENLIGIRLVKAFYNRSFEQNRFVTVNRNLKNTTMKTLRFIELTAPLLLLLMNFCIVLILWYGNREMSFGGAQAGEIVAIVNYGTRITNALSMLTFIIMAFSRAKASSDRINEVLQMEEEVDVEAQDSANATLKGAIEFKNVSFQYFEDHANAISNLSFSVQAGETVAILGATGSGKTSLFQLIPRLFEAKEGEVYIDNQDVRRFPAQVLRQQIGYVPQESFLFTGTIKENIAWGKREATMEEIEQAAQDAQIHDSIMQFPKQYDTIVGQKGVNLSGGQKQRLSIARALVRKPKILLLDDSTSALDLKTEQKLLEAIRGYDCTMLIITQKITTAQHADLILLLDEGELIAKGTHEELLSTSSLYQKIFQSQNREERKENATAANK
ncbi:ABC transporter ATP-binding protein/permease [Caldibacillus lycopersici]|uniref:ABC transporter ATP-binding protein/permease n=1 Tax=Perspicuibacillus lycopersici TaxID=1325689 RepID=A0AAE3IS12_9BACI|nr:ABC transporter ATP-binding protein [Perspicuibacillus lycopersici]MCU9613568.1 ABC transporter ATP-binding protein/permease [Perspicuibacillus lycopersici]